MSQIHKTHFIVLLWNSVTKVERSSVYKSACQSSSWVSRIPSPSSSSSWMSRIPSLSSSSSLTWSLHKHSYSAPQHHTIPQCNAVSHNPTVHCSITQYNPTVHCSIPLELSTKHREVFTVTGEGPLLVESASMQNRRFNTVSRRLSAKIINNGQFG